MAYHVTIDGATDDGLTVEQIAAQMQTLKPASITVDCAGGLGRVLLASLQAKGLPAKALEKRERPTLPEIQRAEQLSEVALNLRDTIEEQRKEIQHLRDYQRDVRILIARLE